MDEETKRQLKNINFSLGLIFLVLVCLTVQLCSGTINVSIESQPENNCQTSVTSPAP